MQPVGNTQKIFAVVSENAEPNENVLFRLTWTTATALPAASFVILRDFELRNLNNKTRRRLARVHTRFEQKFPQTVAPHSHGTC
jgi:hypothetical protein